MFEMFITALATVLVALYGFSRSVFMTGPYRFYYQSALAVVLLILFLYFTVKRWIKHRRIRRMHVDFEEYMYYEKFTSLLYRAGYLISYFIQNILFDYTYMRRNFNFCKGIDVYTGGVGEYYIKFRNTWYRYLQLTLLRPKASVKKLQAYAAQTKNNMILKALDSDEERQICLDFARDTEKAFREKHVIGEHVLLPLKNYEKVPPYFRKNLILIYQAEIYLTRYEPDIYDLVNLMERHSQSDVNDFKKTKYREG